MPIYKKPVSVQSGQISKVSRLTRRLPPKSDGCNDPYAVPTSSEAPHSVIDADLDEICNDCAVFFVIGFIPTKLCAWLSYHLSHTVHLFTCLKQSEFSFREMMHRLTVDPVTRLMSALVKVFMLRCQNSKMCLMTCSLLGTGKP